MSKPRCYAFELGDCRGKITKEHFISASLIKFAQPDTSAIDLGGFAGYSKPTGVQRLANKKMLCEHHNSLLSVLDEEMFRFVKTVFSFNNGDAQAVDESFDGALLTRWMQKYLFGASVAFPSQVRLSEKIEKFELLKFMFGLRSIPENWGLLVPSFFSADNFHTETGETWPPWAVAPLEYPSEGHIGAEVQVFPVRLRYIPGIGPFTGTERFKPRTIRLKLPDREAVLTLRWNGFAGGDIVYSLANVA